MRKKLLVVFALISFIFISGDLQVSGWQGLLGQFVWSFFWLFMFIFCAKRLEEE